jgi:hypothetical protein
MVRIAWYGLGANPHAQLASLLGSNPNNAFTSDKGVVSGSEAGGDHRRLDVDRHAITSLTAEGKCVRLRSVGTSPIRCPLLGMDVAEEWPLTWDGGRIIVW